MKNKLLTTTAIAGLLITGSAFAQTTVTGNLDLSYKGISNNNTKGSSVRGMGKESQINLTNKGKLNNGLDYVAGFSVEHDGAEGGVATIGGTSSTGANSGTQMWNENVYIDIIAGKTTFTIGADHIQNPDYEITNLTGTADLDEIVSGITNSAPAFLTNIGSPYSSFGLGITQDLGVGKFSVYYAPSTASIAGDSHGGFATHQNYVDGANSTYEVGFRGDLGIKGFDLGIFYNTVDSNDRAKSSTSLDNYKVSLRHNFGSLTASAAYAVQEAHTDNAASTQYTVTEKESQSIGLAYALNKDLSVGLAHGRTSDNSTEAKRSNKEKITTLSVGYSLGPISTGLSVGKIDNYGNTANVEGKAAMFQMGAKF